METFEQCTQMRRMIPGPTSWASPNRCTSARQSPLGRRDKMFTPVSIEITGSSQCHTKMVDSGLGSFSHGVNTRDESRIGAEFF